GGGGGAGTSDTTEATQLLVLAAVDGLETTTASMLTALQIIDGVVFGAGTEAAALRVTIATDSTGVLSVDDNGASLTVDNGGTFVVQENGAALTALQLLDNVVAVEDAVAGSGFSGVPFLLVRQDTQLDLAADGDFLPPTIDADGGLRVSIVNGSAGGTSAADDADFTDGTTLGTPIGGVAESAAPSTVTEGDFGWAAITLNRALKVTLYNSSGTELTPSSDQTLDAAISTTGPLLIGRGSTATPTAMTADNDATALWLDLNGRVHLSVEGVEDAAETAGAFLSRVGTVRRDTAASSAGAAGDNATLNTDGLGRAWIRQGDPCADYARVQSVVIDTAASGNVELVALNGSDLIYVCGYSVVAGAATGVQFIYGTGTACATGETDVTGVWSLAANGGITQANAGAPQFLPIPAGNAFCVENSGANSIQGHVTYVRTAAP
ncbi:MAG: hypothetical protein ABL982_19700, partial [Vicinamibacterales bacterium]